MQTTADKLRREGWREGWREGRQEGRRDTLIEMAIAGEIQVAFAKARLQEMAENGQLDQADLKASFRRLDAGRED